jgi:hypothetical protein
MVLRFLGIMVLRFFRFLFLYFKELEASIQLYLEILKAVMALWVFKLILRQDLVGY